MSKKVLALGIILLLTTMSLASFSSIQAASDSDDEWITDYVIKDADSGKVLVEFDASTNETTSLGAVVPGSDVVITFTVNVIASGEGNLQLRSGLSKPSSGPVWGYDDTYDLGSDFSPNSATTEFNWEEGEFEMSVNGRVPSSSSSAKALIAVTLSSPSGKALDKITITATSAEMDNFLNLLGDKEDHLDEMKSSGVDAGYVQIYENVLTAASDVAYGGDVENAIVLLEGLDTSTEPAGSTMQILFLPLVGVAIAVAVIFAVLFLRIRGRISYFQLVVEDQIKDLEGLTLRASKIDRAMSANLDSVKDRLKRLVGM